MSAEVPLCVICSILRGLLPMQRLDKDDNKLVKMPDLIVGHELDWLAFEIALQEPHEGSVWHINGQHEKAVEIQAPSIGSTNVFGPNESPSLTHKNAQSARDAKVALTNSSQSPAMHGEGQNGQVNYIDLLSIRVRLSHLTGHNSFKKLDNSEYQMWKDDQVNARTRARKLSAAIYKASESLFKKRPSKSDIMLRIRVVMSPDPGAHLEQLISVVLKPPPESSQTGWSIDSAYLKAILGLWMWSLISDGRLESNDDSGNRISDAETIEAVRIVLAGIDDENWHHKTNLQGEMNLWLGYNAVTLRDDPHY